MKPEEKTQYPAALKYMYLFVFGYLLFLSLSLEILHTEIAFHPDKMVLNSLFEEKESCQFTSSAVSQFVRDGRMGMQDFMNVFEYATIEAGCVCINVPNLKAIHNGRK